MAGVPLLSELMPWSVAGLRVGRGWVRSAHPEVLAARWRRLAEADPVQRAELFRPSRSRTVDSAVPQLPGQATSTRRLSQEPGSAPEPVRVRHGAFDRQWLLADQRLLDQPRPELWRVADGRQLFAAVQPVQPVQPVDAEDGPAVAFSTELPDGARPKGVGRIHPLYRRPGGLEPNLTPGLTALLRRKLGVKVRPEELLAWIAAVTAHPLGRTGEDVPVPLPADPGLWAEGLDLGRRVLWLHTFGERSTTGLGPLRMPGGRRPFVRERVTGLPDALEHDPEDDALLIGTGRLSPVARSAWGFRAAGEPVLTRWFAERCADPEARPGTLEALALTGWPQQYTADLVDLVTVLTLLAELRPALTDLTARAAEGGVGTADLTAAGVLPVRDHSRRPASVLLHHEEGPDGQFALL
ncbi:MULTISPECIES: type ISP restriction/modification enzyme [Streptacidiphilus]|uniref:Type ISP restriction/modification enzyme n=1 Tax=Streptacidiphilus cavernicola TaxID=3342716 RepID=A0ABV6UJV3_9ACTN|nr:type ISP restriction/modification enzyme [Streptacidiphilus jeojiense]